ncbi:hypothetical protein FRX31_005809, partial [Thalictrum thalictroides]
DHSGNLTNCVITLWYRPPDLLLGTTKYGPALLQLTCGPLVIYLRSFLMERQSCKENRGKNEQDYEGDNRGSRTQIALSSYVHFSKHAKVSTIRGRLSIYCFQGTYHMKQLVQKSGKIQVTKSIDVASPK